MSIHNEVKKIEERISDAGKTVETERGAVASFVKGHKVVCIAAAVCVAVAVVVALIL